MVGPKGEGVREMPKPSEKEELEEFALAQKIFFQIIDERRRSTGWRESGEVEKSIMADVKNGVKEALRDAKDLTRQSYIKYAEKLKQELPPYQVRAYRQALDELGVEEHEGKLSRNE